MAVVRHYAIAPENDGLALDGGALVSVEAGWLLPEVLAAFAPRIGRPTYLRLAAHAEVAPESWVRLHVFDTAGSQPVDAEVPPELRPAFDRWLAEQRGAPVPPGRSAWAAPGWHAETEAWAGERLEPHRFWPLSAVLRGESGFVKCVFPLFAAEPALTAALAREHPGRVPEIVKIDSIRGLMQMRTLPDSDVTAANAGPVVRTLAEIQRMWAVRTDELLALGAQDRRRELPELPLPDTLVHGDFHAGNATLRGDEAVIFDWSDAAVAQPLFDLHAFLHFLGDESERDNLVAAYAEGWAGVASADAISSALEIAAPHSCLHQAESYRAIVAAVEPDDHWWFADAEREWRERATAVSRAS